MSAPIPLWPPDSPLALATQSFDLHLAVCPAPGLRPAQSLAVRACASELLRRAGVLSPEIGRHRDGQPLWPPGWVGSLTHSRTLGAVVLAPAARLRGLGLDLEDPLRMKRGLWAHVLASAELTAVSHEPEASARHRATAIFSAKEAIYKTLAPLTPHLPGFHDVELVWETPVTFRVQAAAGRTVAAEISALRGLIVDHAAHVLALCWLPRS